MPFLTADGAPVTEVELLQRDARRFQLVIGFSYLDPTSGRDYPIPPHDVTRPPDADGGNSTDLASVPAFLWGLIPSYGLQTRAAVLHDRFAGLARDAGGEAGWRIRRDADRVFRVALLESDVTLLRATVMWVGVCAHRYVQGGFGLGRAVAGSALLAAGIALVYAAPVLAVLFGPVWLLVALLPLPAALLRFPDRGYFAVGPYLGALFVPFLAAAALDSLLFFVLGALVWLLAGRRGARPVAHPRSRTRLLP